MSAMIKQVRGNGCNTCFNSCILILVYYVRHQRACCVWLVTPKAMRHAQHTHAQLFTVQINCFVVEAVISVRCIYRKRRTAPCPFQFKLDRVLILIFSTKIHFMKAYLTSEWKLNTWKLRGAYVFTQFVWFGTHTHTDTRVHVLQAFGTKVKTTSEKTLEWATHGAKMCNSTHNQNQINQKVKWRNNNNFYPVKNKWTKWKNFSLAKLSKHCNVHWNTRDVNTAYNDS